MPRSLSPRLTAAAMNTAIYDVVLTSAANPPQEMRPQSDAGSDRQLLSQQRVRRTSGDLLGGLRSRDRTHRAAAVDFHFTSSWRSLSGDISHN